MEPSEECEHHQVQLIHLCCMDVDGARPPFGSSLNLDSFAVRLGGAKSTSERNAVQQQPVFNALSKTPGNRDVRVGEPTDWCVAFSGDQCIIFVDYSRL